MASRIFDKALSNKSLILHGGAAVDSTLSPVGTNPIKLTTAGDYAEIQRKESSWYFGTGDYTVEMWVNFRVMPQPNNYANFLTFSNGTDWWQFCYRQDQNKLVLSTLANQEPTGRVTCSFTPVAGTWYHIATTCQSGTNNIFVNGVLTGSNVASTNIADLVGNMIIGSASNQNFDGYMDEVRVSKGIARYTSAFTPQTTRFVSDQYTTLLLHGDSFQDSSYDNHNVNVTGATINTTYGVPKIGKGCFDFSGGSKYLTVPYKDDFYVADRDFTLEAWVNLTTIPSTPDNFMVVAIDGPGYWTNGGNQICWGMMIFGNGTTPELDIYLGSGFHPAQSFTMNALTWFHVAMCRSGNILKTFINGNILSTYDVTGLSSTPCTLPLLVGGGVRVGGGDGYLTYGTGNIDGLRISKGIAHYTSNFTPGLVPFDRRENNDLSNKTKLLIKAIGDNGSQTIKDDSKWNRDITVTGNVKLDSTKGDYSLYFDGSSYLTIPFSSDWVLGSATNKWCVEFNYCADTALTADRHIIKQGLAGSPYTGWYLHHQTDTNKLAILMYNQSGTSSYPFVSNGTLPIGQWINVCLMNDGNTIKLFLNGVVDKVVSSFDIQISTEPLIIGYNNGYNLKGWLSNLRIVRDDEVYAQNTFGIGDSDSLSSCKLCLRMDGSLSDSSPSATTVTNNGLTFDVVNKFFGTHSAYFNGSSYCSVPYNYDGILFGTGNFTIDFWLKGTADGPVVYQGGPTGSASEMMIWANVGSGKFNYSPDWVNYPGSSHIITSTTSVNDNKWHHIAIVRNGAYFKLFIDGIEEGTPANLGTGFSMNVSAYPFRLGMGSNPNYYTGNIDNFKVYKGFAKYTANFNPYTVDGLTWAIQPLPTLFTKDSDTSCKLCLRLDNNVTDASPSERTVTNNNVTFDASNKVFGTHSTYYNGSSSYLTTSYSSDFDFGSGDWTIEFWCKPNRNSPDVDTILTIDKNSQHQAYRYLFEFFTNGSGIISLGVSDMTNQYSISNSTSIVGSWHHIAGVRSGSTIKLYVDGVSVGTPVKVTSFTIPVDTSMVLNIGSRYGAGADSYQGWVDNVKVYKGLAKYTSNFNPYGERIKTLQLVNDGTSGNDGSTKLLLHLNNDFRDTAKGVTTPATVSLVGTPVIDHTFSKFAGGSCHFTNGSYLTIPGAAVNPRTSDFTIEAWWYINGNATNPMIYSHGDATESIDFFYYNPQSFMVFQDSRPGNGYGFRIVVTMAIPSGQWHHFAGVRCGASAYLFMDGNLIGTSANEGSDINRPMDAYLGGDPSTTNRDVYIQEFRYSKVGRYTTNFIPPARPFNELTDSVTDGAIVGNDSNTKLLLHLNSDFKDYAVGASQINVPFIVGTPTISKSIYKIGDGSCYFGGILNHIQIADSTDWDFTSSNVTIEMYINKTGSTFMNLIGQSTSNSADWFIYVYDNGAVAVGINSVNEISTATGVISNNQWYHVAVVKNASTVKIYVDGIERASNTTVVFNNSANMLYVASQYTGYMQEVTISKSAKYTTNFTPTSLPYIAPTSNVIVNSIADKLVACYKFDELVTTDSGPSKYDWTNYGVTQGVGKFGKCAVFNGSSYLGGGLSYNGKTPIITNVNYFAGSIWVKFTNPTATDDTIYQLSSASTGDSVKLSKYRNADGDTTNRICFRIISNTNTIIPVFSVVPTIDTWYHIFFYVSVDSAIYLYVNGVKYKTAISIASINPCVYEEMGEQLGNVNRFNGSADEFYLWNSDTALFQSESHVTAFATALYNNGNGKFIAG